MEDRILEILKCNVAASETQLIKAAKEIASLLTESEPTPDISVKEVYQQWLKETHPGTYRKSEPVSPDKDKIIQKQEELIKIIYNRWGFYKSDLPLLKEIDQLKGIDHK
jgi:hypothetical protein